MRQSCKKNGRAGTRSINGTRGRQQWLPEALEARQLLSVTLPAAAQVNPGFSPGRLVADPVRNDVYVLDETNNRVNEIDTTIGVTVNTTDLAATPTDLAISPDDQELYVSVQSANLIQVFSLPDLNPLRQLAVSTPGLIAVGTGQRVYVAGNSQWSAVRQVDGVSGAVLNSFGSYYDALPRTNTDGTELYVSELGLSTTGTDSYDISDPTQAPVAGGSFNTDMSNGRDLAVDDQYNRLYSMSGGVYGVYSVDLTTNLGTYWSFNGAAYGTSVGLSANVPYIYGGSQDPYNGGIFQFDRATGAVLNRYIPVGAYTTVWDLAVTPNGNVIYEADPTYSQTGYQLGIIGLPSLTVGQMPTANPGGAYTVSEGSSVTLNGLGSSDAESALTQYNWDFNYDGNPADFVTTATGANPVFSAANLEGPTTLEIGLQVVNAAGITSTITTTTVTVDSVAPTAVFTGSTVTLGNPGTVSFSNQFNPSLAETTEGFTYSYDLLDNDTFDIVDTISSSATVPSSDLATVGPHTVRARIEDAGGGYTDYTTTVQVNPPAAVITKLAGTIIGTSGSYQNNGNTIAKAFDGNLTTYYDGASANGNWLGLDLGSGYTITSVAFVSRSGSGLPARMNGGIFQASNSANFSSGVVNLYTIATNANPSSTAFTTQAISNTGVFRYVRYLSPNGSYGDVAELQFYGTPATVVTPTTGTVSGTLTGPASATVYLDANNNGILDNGELSTTATGSYSFSSVPVGSYVVRQVVPSGYTQATPASGYSISVTAGSSFTGENFVDTANTTNPTGPAKLTGTVIGTSGSYQNAGNTIAKALDGSLTTYFDGPTANGNWVGLDLGSTYVITSVSYASRSGLASRMNGGIFQGSNSATFASGVVNLYTIGSSANPSSTALTTQTISNTTAFRYVRYLSPNGSYGDVAEVQFFGTASGGTVTPPPTLTQFTGTTIGTAGSYQNDGTTIAKATDGSLATFYDGASANGNWVGLDLGSAQIVKQISFAPRSSPNLASRMVGGIFQASNTADFSSGVVNLYTVTTAPAVNVLTSVTVNVTTAYRYYRYLSPNGSYGDVAEIAFYG